MSVTLDMGAQVLSLLFNEPVRLSTVDVTAIRLQQVPIHTYIHTVHTSKYMHALNIAFGAVC